jgi:hypothetical protein
MEQMWLDNEKGFNFSSYVYRDNELATHSSISIDELCDDHVGNGDSGEKEGENKHILEAVTGIVILLRKLLNNSFTCTGLVSVMNRTF